MHKVMEELSKYDEIKKKLTEMVEGEVCEGKEYFSDPKVVEGTGQIVDMIKDLAQIEKDCMEKKYYEMMICAAMSADEELEEVGRMGYDNWRYSSGKFAEKGHGKDVGHGRSLKMGYAPDSNIWPPYVNPHMPQPIYDEINGGPMGYPMDDIRQDENRIGQMYEEYKRAKKHYTQSHDEKDSHKMNEVIMENTMEVSEAIGEMWRDANPETRKEMKEHLKRLLDAWEKGK